MSAFRDLRHSAIDALAEAIPDSWHQPLLDILFWFSLICLVTGLMILACVYHLRFKRKQKRRWLREAGVPESGMQDALDLEERYAAYGLLLARFGGVRLYGWNRWDIDDNLRCHPLVSVQRTYRELLDEEAKIRADAE